MSQTQVTKFGKPLRIVLNEAIELFNFSPKRILDLYCGDMTWQSKEIRMAFPDVKDSNYYAVEINKEKCENVRLQYPKINLYCGDVLTYLRNSTIDGNTFDLIVVDNNIRPHETYGGLLLQVLAECRFLLSSKAVLTFNTYTLDQVDSFWGCVLENKDLKLVHTKSLVRNSAFHIWMHGGYLKNVHDNT